MTSSVLSAFSHSDRRRRGNGFTARVLYSYFVWSFLFPLKVALSTTTILVRPCIDVFGLLQLAHSSRLCYSHTQRYVVYNLGPVSIHPRVETQSFQRRKRIYLFYLYGFTRHPALNAAVPVSGGIRHFDPRDGITRHL